MGTADISEIEVTPAIAGMWLEKNIVNRKVSRGRVAQYARAMESGRWVATNDAICLAPDGTLLNGQHRLMAVIQSDSKVKMLIRRNVPEAAMAHMDRQYTRSYTQQLALKGESNVALLGSTLRLCVAFSQGIFPAGSAGNAVGDTDMNIYLENNPEIRESVDVGSKVKTMVDATPTSLAATHWWISRVAGHDMPAMYLQQLGEPMNEPPESAVHSIRRRLKTASLQRLENRNYVYLLVKGWNAYAEGKTFIKPLMAPKNGRFHIPEPLPWSRNTTDILV